MSSFFSFSHSKIEKDRNLRIEFVEKHTGITDCDIANPFIFKYKIENIGTEPYHENPIPKDFKGEILFMTKVFGPYNDENDDNLENKNWIFFDNFQLFDKSRQVDIPYFSVSPNPVSDIIFFRPVKPIDAYSIYFYDYLGREIDHFIDIEGIFQYDIQKLPGGIISFQIIKENQLIQKGKIAVLN